jgi:hypothetical protein
MKSIIEILGGAQTLLGISFDLDTIFEERLSPEYKAFLALIGLIEEKLPRKTGSPPYIFWSFTQPGHPAAAKGSGGRAVRL